MRISSRPGPALVAAFSVALTLAAVAPLASAQLEPPNGAFYAVLRLDELDFDDAPPTARLQSSSWAGGRPLSQIHGVVLDAPARGVLAPAFNEFRSLEPASSWTLAVRAPAPLSVHGELNLEMGSSYAPHPESSRLAFEIPAGAFSADAREDYLRALATRDALLVEEGAAGAAYFRRRLARTRELLGEEPGREIDARARDTSRRGTMRDSYELFSGARAISENLALDRRLPASSPGEELVPLTEIQGVTIRPYDWDELVAELAPEPDPLAALIPPDQYAAFFPDFGALLALGDHAEAFGTPVVQLAEPRAVRSGLRAQLEQQLALPASTLARLLGPSVIRSVAVTGAGFELRSGSDVAVLFEAAEPKLLHALVTARVRTEAGALPDAVRTDGALHGIAYEHYATPDRRLCSYVAQLRNAVVVTNSLPQLERLVDTHQGRRDSLLVLPEYTFFRARYPRGADDESAFVLLSDATIRRWCGPRWRIGASRLVRARAALRDLEVRHLKELADGSLSGELPTPDEYADLGALQVSAGTLQSSVWGSSRFSTPVLELDFDAVTEEEAALYERWRQNYESNWQANFDPIAARLHIDAEQLELDLSVRPLTTNSDYREFIERAGDGSLPAWGGDPHPESVWHFTTALGEEARRTFQQSPVGMFSALNPALDPFQWLGDSVSFWADNDPFFDELAAATAADAEDEFMGRNVHRLPLALHAEVANGFALAAFLTGVRAGIEGSAPGMLAWETRDHGGEAYVRIGPTERALDDFDGMGDDDVGFRELALYYVATGQGLTLSLNEELVKRAIDRQLQRREAGREPGADAADARRASAAGEPDWLGTHVGVKLDLDELAPFAELALSWQSATPVRRLSWSNLPILDEWHALFPDEDPVVLHRRLWGETLLCPGGGEYRWNTEDGVMESSVFGHPGRPRTGPVLPPLVHTLARADLGLSFEEDGLRARARLELQR